MSKTSLSATAQLCRYLNGSGDSSFCLKQIGVRIPQYTLSCPSSTSQSSSYDSKHPDYTLSANRRN